MGVSKSDHIFTVVSIMIVFTILLILLIQQINKKDDIILQLTQQLISYAKACS